MELNNLEIQLLQELVATTSYKEIINHIALLVVKERVSTKLGINIVFEYKSNVNPLMKEGYSLEALLSAPKIVTIPQLKKGLGFVLDIEGGMITSLDIYMNDISEKWDESIGSFSIVDK